MDAGLTVEQLMATLRAATEEQRAEILGLLGAAPTPAKKAVGGAGAKKTAVPAARKAAAAAPLPEPEEDGAPSAASYRIKEEDIDHAVCVARVLKGGEDKRWKPVIYREFQCGKAVEEDCDLCKTCQARLEKYAESPKPGDWTGRVTEEPLGWVHMLDTEWADARKPKWLGEGASASDSGSEASSAASSAAASKASKAAEKEAEKAAKAAEKEAAKAAKEAEKAAKAAEKEAAKAAKEAEKAAKAAEKEAAKQAKEAEKAAKAAAKASKPAPAKKEAAPAVKKAAGGAGAAAAAPVAPAKADSAATAEEVEGEIILVDGVIYWAKGKKVYKYDEDTEGVGEYVGRLTADELIDSSVAEDDE